MFSWRTYGITIIYTRNQGAGDHIDSVDLVIDLVEAKILNASDHIDVTRSITLVSHCRTRSRIWDSFFLSKNHELIEGNAGPWWQHMAAQQIRLDAEPSWGLGEQCTCPARSASLQGGIHFKCSLLIPCPPLVPLSYHSILFQKMERRTPGEETDY